MAGPNRGSSGQPPSLKRTVQSDAVRGSPRIRKWPRPQSAATKAKTAEHVEWFRQAQWLTKYISPGQMKVAMESTRGTPLMPRDLLTMAMAGRLWLIVDENGKEIWPVAVRNDISQALDILSKKPGSIMYRGPDIWEGSKPPLGSLNALFATDDGRVEWRPVMALQQTYKTRLERTTNITASGIIDMPWQTAIFDEAGLWNPEVPHLITAPADGTMKISWQVYAATAITTTRNIVVYRNSDNRIMAAQADAGMNFAQVTADWFPVTDGDAFRCTQTGSGSNTYEAQYLWATAEFIPSP